MRRLNKVEPLTSREPPNVEVFLFVSDMMRFGFMEFRGDPVGNIFGGPNGEGLSELLDDDGLASRTWETLRDVCPCCGKHLVDDPHPELSRELAFIVKGLDIDGGEEIGQSTTICGQCAHESDTLSDDIRRTIDRIGLPFPALTFLDAGWF